MTAPMMLHAALDVAWDHVTVGEPVGDDEAVIVGVHIDAVAGYALGRALLEVGPVDAVRAAGVFAVCGEVARAYQEALAEGLPS